MGQLFDGTYNLYEVQPTLNGKAVYQMGDYCLNWNWSWRISTCVSLGSGSSYITSSSTTKQCVHGYEGSWSWNGNDDSTMAATCPSACSGDPPSAPDGSTSDWDGSSNSAGTIVTYTCSDEETSMAVCDAATSSWLPSTIPDCTSGGGNIAPSPVPVPAPVPAPAPTPIPTPKDCIEKNKVTVLKTLVKKKIKTVQLCQDYCYENMEATLFKWKWNKQAKKRICWCQAVGYNTKKSFSSGPVIC